MADADVFADEFWMQRSDHAPFAQEDVERAEEKLGVKLPKSFLMKMRVSNGGAVRKRALVVPHAQRYLDWMSPPLMISIVLSLEEIEWQVGFYDAGVDRRDLVQFAWGEDAGSHFLICFDYSECGASGEPRVVCISSELDFSQIVWLAPSFDAYSSKLFYHNLEDAYGVLGDSSLSQEKIVELLAEELGLSLETQVTRGDQFGRHPRWVSSPRNPEAGPAAFYVRSNWYDTWIDREKKKEIYATFSECPQARWIISVDVHPRHREQVRAAFARLPFKTVVAHQTDWKVWGPNWLGRPVNE